MDAADQTGSTQEAGAPPSDDADSTQQEAQQAASEPAGRRHLYRKLAQHAKQAGARASRLGRAAVADGSRVSAAVQQEAQRLQAAAVADASLWGGWVQVSLCTWFAEEAQAVASLGHDSLAAAHLPQSAPLMHMCT